MLFSIIIPTYNRSDYILAALNSVLNQTNRDFEVIIVDDGSEDNTEEVLRPYLNDVVRYYRIINSERGAARNVGAINSRGKYLTFLDSDDLYYTNYLMNAAESIDRFNEPNFMHLGYEILSHDGKVKTKIDSLKNDNITFLIKGNPMSCMGVFLKRDVFLAHKFNEDRKLAGSEDWELWIRIAAHYGIKVDNRISAALIDHSTRSVLNYKENELVERMNLALFYAFQDEKVKNVFEKRKSIMSSYCDSYVALHLILAGKKQRGLHYFLASLKKYPFSLFERRSLAIVKRFLLPTK